MRRPQGRNLIVSLGPSSSQINRTTTTSEVSERTKLDPIEPTNAIMQISGPNIGARPLNRVEIPLWNVSLVENLPPLPPL